MMRLSVLTLLTGLAATSAVAQDTPTPGSTDGPDIVVTGMTLKDAKAALAACIANRCPPDKDIDATLAVAETQFVAGDYKAARETMLKSISRNQRFAKSYPVPVSDLLRANSRVAAHLGESGSYFSSAIGVVDALKSGLGADDARVLGARIELADAYAKTQRLNMALDLYRDVAKRAKTLNLPRIEGYALLRVAIATSSASSVRNDAYYDAALSAADALINNPDPDLAPFASAARLLKLKMAVKNGDPGAINRLVAAYRDAGAKQTTPVLLYAPKIDAPDRSNSSVPGGQRVGETLGLTMMDTVEDQWVDISFEIRADGTVSEVEVLRKSAKLTGDWVKPILASIAGRRYAPMAANSPAALRVERYTFTSPWETRTGTNIRRRSARPTIEVVDLTRDPVTTAATTAPPKPAS